MTSVSLPELPLGKEFEEFVSAYFQSGGLFVERNIIERGIEEVLELDIITTDYEEMPPEIRLHEIKSGEWGFADIFKLRGWIDYLNLQNALLVVSKGRTNFDFIEEKANSLNIDLAVIEKLTETDTILDVFYPNEEVNQDDIEIWRFSYWVERNLLKQLNAKKKSHKERKSYSALEKYYYDVSSGIFFNQNIVDRVEKLYNAFRTYPRISAKCANELTGGNFDDDASTVPLKVFKETYYKCNYTDIQISTFIEHRARLALLKSAIDFKMYEKAGIKEKLGESYKLLGIEIPALAFLPHTFSSSLEKISSHKFFHRYPVFWQWFLWYFGGFILKDYEEQEYKLLSAKTGVPVDEIPNAFKAYEMLFPLENGWLMDLQTSNIKLMRMFSVPFMGIGANTRRIMYAEDQSFEKLKLSSQYGLNDLVKWNNLAVEVLTK